MQIIGRLSDAGQLVIRGENLGRAEFDIVVFGANGNAQAARGTLNCDYNLLYRALDGGDSYLRLNSGQNLQFSVMQIESFGAEILINSDVPGFSPSL
jgi:hypothetical protein